MRTVAELTSAFVLMILAFLVLQKYTGAAQIIAALGRNLALLARTFQGR